MIASITLSSFSNHKSLNILLGLETSRYLWGEAIVWGGGGGQPHANSSCFGMGIGLKKLKLEL